MHQFKTDLTFISSVQGNHMPRFAAAALLLSLFVVQHSLAQNITGTLLGTVQDSSQSPISGASVAVRNLETNQENQTTTTALGYFEAPYLRPGSYEVRVSFSGFKTSVRNRAELTVDSRLRLDFTLEIGDSATSLAVAGIHCKCEV